MLVCTHVCSLRRCSHCTQHCLCFCTCAMCFYDCSAAWRCGMAAKNSCFYPKCKPPPPPNASPAKIIMWRLALGVGVYHRWFPLFFGFPRYHPCIFPFLEVFIEVATLHTMSDNGNQSDNLAAQLEQLNIDDSLKEVPCIHAHHVRTPKPSGKAPYSIAFISGACHMYDPGEILGLRV